MITVKKQLKENPENTKFDVYDDAELISLLSTDELANYSKKHLIILVNTLVKRLDTSYELATGLENDIYELNRDMDELKDYKRTS